MLDFGAVKGAIFDMDGTLLDSMPIWRSMAADYLRSIGVEPQPDLYDVLFALEEHERTRFIQTEYGVRKPAAEIRSGIYGILEDFYLNKAPVKDGVIAVLEALRGLGVKMCVATATDRWLAEPALRSAGLLGYFGRVFTCGEENTDKSRPDIYVRAASFLGTAVRETLVVEDAPYAIYSAKKAGFPVAAVYDLSADGRQDELIAICDYYCKSMGDMLI